MKYTVTAHVTESVEVVKEISIRTGAKMGTVFQRCMVEIGRELIERKVIAPSTQYQYDLPNIWRNGCLGAAWFIDPLINVTIRQGNGAWLAL